MRGDARPGSEATAGLIAFAGLLRRLGLEVGTPRVELALRALESVDASDREQTYWALRSTLTSRLEDLPDFDAAFTALWEGPLPVRPAAPAPQGAGPTAGAGAGEGPSAPERSREAPGAEQGAGAGRRWSAVERLRRLDFRSYGPEELAESARLVAELARSLPRRRSRRLRPARGGRHPDRRATLRRAMRTEGHPLDLAWRRPSSRPRRIVFAVDVSGSMEPYARPVMMFLQAARQASRDVEAFAFGTRLTRLTDELGGRYPDAALDRVARAVPDWAGGTRIGDNLKRLNDVWGRRGTIRGTVLVIVSDGWERGDVELLRRQMERLQRASYRLIWVNPLAGDPRYEPLAAGMAAAMPYVDDFLAGHNLRGLEQLAAALSAAASPSAARREGPRSPSRMGGLPAGKPYADEVQPASGP